MNPLVGTALSYALVLLSWEQGGWLFWFACLLALLALFSWRPRKILLPIGAGIVLAGLVLALWQYSFPRLPWQEGQKVTVEGEWLETSPTAYGWKGILRTDAGKVLVYTGTEIGAGRRARVSGKAEKPPLALNPGQFDYRRYLWHRKISWQIKADRVSDLGPGSSWRLALAGLRGQISQQALNNAPGRSGTLLAAMVWGQEQYLESETRDGLNRAGLAHLLSVSGFHVSLLAVPVWLWSRRLGGSPWWRLGAALTLALFYGALSGFEPPVLRALIMLALAMLGRELGQGKDDEAGLALALFLTSFTQPLLITEAGYQLTFLATWALLVPGRQLRGRWAWLFLPLLVQAFTLPALIYHFHYFNPWSLLANLLLTPVATLALWLGFLAGSLGWFWPLWGQALYPAAALPVLLLLAAADLIQQLPGARLAFRGWSAAATVLFLLVLAWFLRGGWAGSSGLWLRGWSWRLLPGRWRYGLAIGLVIGCFSLYWRWSQQDFQVTWLAVGEGFAAVITTPTGETYLLDAGPAGKRVVGAYLAQAGIDHLRGVIITHPHADHYGGLEELMGKVSIDWLAAGPGAWQEPALAALGQSWQREGTRLLTWQQGEDRQLAPGMRLRVLMARTAGEDWNQRSLVIELKKDNYSLLFTGDADRQGLDQLASAYRPQDLLAVTMPHHGSRDGASGYWLQRWQPRLAVIPVGPNRYGHPHQETLLRLQRQGIAVLRTDRQGAVSLSWPEGEEPRISFFRQEEP
ncbi:MAG: DNA internalization-related competence protein ComEC/Rec2 [Bacillota bacterium]